MKLLLYSISIFISISTLSQNTKLKKTFTNKVVNSFAKNNTLKKVYVNPEVEASPKINFHNFFLKNFLYPDSSRIYGQKGAVRIKFIVELNGTITNMKVDKDSPNNNKPLIDEVIRVLKLTNGKWNAAKDKGKVVRSWHTQMFNICLFEDE